MNARFVAGFGWLILLLCCLKACSQSGGGDQAPPTLASYQLAAQALALDSLQVYVRDEAAGDTTRSQPRLFVKNTSGETSWANIKLHYYLTAEGGHFPQVDVYWAPSSEVTVEHVTGDVWRVVYDYDGVTLAPGEVLPDFAGSVVGLSYGESSAWDAGNDWSNYHVATAFSQTDRVVVVAEDGSLIAGTPPPEVAEVESGSDEDGGASPADASDVPTSDAGSLENPLSFSIKFPSGVYREEIALGTAGGDLWINDGVVIHGFGRPYASVSAVENAGVARFGVEAEALHVYGEAHVNVAERANIIGDVRGGVLSIADSATVAGHTSSGENFQPLQEVEWTVGFPLTVPAEVLLEPGQARYLTPGNYGRIAVKRDAVLTLSPGSYTMERLTVEPGGVLRLENTASVMVSLRQNFIFRGLFEREVEAPNVLFAAAGGEKSVIESEFAAIVAVPNATLELATLESGRSYRGSFFARSLTVHQWTDIHHEPFLPQHFCPADAACSSFCPCSEGSPCETGAECAAGNTCSAGTCACAPLCDSATCESMADGCGGSCPLNCSIGETGCVVDADCSELTCRRWIDEAGTPAESIGICLPMECADRTFFAEHCGAGTLCGQCPECVPDCEGKTCGDDGCGGTCGEPADGEYCSVASLVQSVRTTAAWNTPEFRERVEQPFETNPPRSGQSTGATAGKFEVTDEGRARYTVPISVPPGRAGMQPQLALVYESSHRNGMLGIGWGLSGLSRIERCPRAAYHHHGFHHDNGTPNALPTPYEARPVRLDEKDAYCLDGERLYGKREDGVVRLYTERESFSRITMHGPADNPTSFTVETKDGRILQYGERQGTVWAGIGGHVPVTYRDAVIETGGVRRVWGLSTASDRAGNLVAYRYQGYESGHVQKNTDELLPAKIVYGANRDVPELISNRGILFEYQERPDPRDGFVAGYPVRLSKVISGITTVVHDRVVRRYELQYDQTALNETQLGRITECGGESEGTICLAPTVFEYEQPVLDIPIITVGFDVIDGTVIDLDGDGRDDLVSSLTYDDSGGEPKAVALSVARLSPLGEFEVEELAFDAGSGGKSDWVREVYDLDGDGRLDIAGGGRWWLNRTHVGGGFEHREIPMATPMQAFAFVDVHGRGIRDLLDCSDRLEGKRHPIYVGLGISSAEPPSLAYGRFDDAFRCASRLWRVFDVDGDGDEEFLLFDKKPIEKNPPAVWRPLYSNERGSTAYDGAGLVDAGFALNAAPLQAVHKLGEWTIPVDVNGDGLKDLWQVVHISEEMDSVVYIWVNTGTGFVPVRSDPEGIDSVWRDFLRPCGPKPDELIVDDLNGDGREDIFSVGARGALFSGPNLTLTYRRMIAPETDAPCQNWGVQGDFYGDGTTQAVWRRSNRGQEPPVETLLVRPGTSGAGLLRLVRDGLGKQIEISYDPASSAPSASAGERTYVPSTETLPMGLGAFPTYEAPAVGARGGIREALVPELVSSYRVRQVVDAGVVKEGPTYHYRYFDGRFGQYGRGWYGFALRTIETFSPEGELQERLTIRGHNDEQWRAGLIQQVVRTIYDQDGTGGSAPNRAGPLVHATSSSWERRVSESGRPFAFLSRRIHTEALGPEIFRYRIETHELGSYGNTAWTLVQDLNGAGEALETVEVETDYEIAPDDWLIANPELVTVTGTRGERSVARTTRYEYSRGLLTAVVREPDAGGEAGLYHRTDLVRYAPPWNVIRVVESDLDERRITDVYYGEDQVHAIAAVNALGQVTEVATDPATGFQLAVMDEGGVSTRWRYDGLGRIVGVEHPTHEEHFSRHTAVPQASRVLGATVPAAIRVDHWVQGEGSSSTFVDAFGAVTKTTRQGFEGVEVHAEFERDWAGRPTRSTLPYAETSRGYVVQEYDGAGRVVRVLTPDGLENRYEYITRGDVHETGSDLFDAPEAMRAVVGRQPDGAVSVVVLNHRELPVLSVQSDSSTVEGGQIDLSAESVAATRYSYGAFGVLRSVADPDGEVTAITVDRVGRREVLENPTLGRVQFAYNGFDEPTESLNASGRRFCRAYDGLGRLSVVERALDPESCVGERELLQYFQYDEQGAVGRLTSTLQRSESADGGAFVATRYGYHPSTGQVTDIAREIPGLPDTVTTSLVYEGTRVSRVTYPSVTGSDPLTVYYDFDNFGNLMRAGPNPDGSDPFWLLAETEEGQFRKLERFGSGTEVGYEYYQLGDNSAGCAQGYSCMPGALKSIQIGHSGSPEGRSISYRYDPLGRVAARGTQEHPQAPSFTSRFEYDVLGRVVNETNSGPGFAATTAYYYTKGGDITGIEGDGAFSAQYHYDSPVSSHHLTSLDGRTFDYDAAGNQTLTQGENFLREVVYDSFERPAAIRTLDEDVHIAYEASGARASKRSSDRSLFYAGDLWECEGATQANDELFACQSERFKIYAGARVAEVERTPGAETIMYLQSDLLGSVVQIRDEEGNLVEAREYELFGEVSKPSLESLTVRAGFTGHDHEVELSLINMKGRLYDPMQRRFISADPYVFEPLNPQGLNRYSYVQNSPATTVDPSGYRPESFFHGGGYETRSGGSGGSGGPSSGEIVYSIETVFGYVQGGNSEAAGSAGRRASDTRPVGPQTGSANGRQVRTEDRPQSGGPPSGRNNPGYRGATTGPQVSSGGSGGPSGGDITYSMTEGSNSGARRSGRSASLLEIWGESTTHVVDTSETWEGALEIATFIIPGPGFGAKVGARVTNWLARMLGKAATPAARAVPKILSNQAAGKIIGWPTGQAAAGRTAEMVRNLTAEQVAAMRAQGLNRATVENLRATYQKAIEAGGAKLRNEQLLPRAQLMDRILELWSK